MNRDLETQSTIFSWWRRWKLSPREFPFSCSSVRNARRQFAAVGNGESGEVMQFGSSPSTLILRGELARYRGRTITSLFYTEFAAAFQFAVGILRYSTGELKNGWMDAAAVAWTRLAYRRMPPL